MSPTVTRSNGILDGAGSRASQQQQQQQSSSRTSALPADNNGTATSRRNRTHSLSEDVHVAELKNAGPAAKKLPLQQLLRRLRCNTKEEPSKPDFCPSWKT